MKLLIEILLNISGWNIMSNYKMGYTLIETILVIAIVFILGGITITLSIESINDYNLSLSNCYYEDKFDNALLNKSEFNNMMGWLVNDGKPENAMQTLLSGGVELL